MPTRMFTPEQAADFIIRARWWWLLLGVTLAAVALARIDSIWPLTADSRVFFAEENPDRQALDEFEGMFNKSESIAIAVEAVGGNVFEPEILAVIGEITDEAWQLPFVRRVQSITNFPHTAVEGDDMIVRDLVVDPPNATVEEAAEAREIALDQVELLNYLVSPAGDVTLVSVLFTLPNLDPSRETPEIADAVQALRDRIEEKHPGVRIHLSGSVLINHIFLKLGVEDSRNLLGPMFLVLLAIVAISIRSFVGTFGVLLVAVLSALCGLGALGWLGHKLNLVTVLVPLHIMALAVASVVHLLSACRQNMVKGDDRREWVREALVEHMSPIIVTCATTAIGFFCFNFSISPPFRQAGTAVGFGMLAVMVLSLTVLPALLVILPLGRHPKPPVLASAMDRISWFVIARRKWILPVSALAVITLALGITQIRLEDDFIRYVDERYEFRQDADFIENRLTGILNLEFPLPSGESQGIYEPEYLREVEAFVDWLRRQSEVTYVRSISDTLKRINQNMYGGDPGRYRLPATREEASQFLFLYELSLGYGMDLTESIDLDRSTTRITAFFANTTTAAMHALTLRAGEWFPENAPVIQAAWDAANPGVERVTPTGPVHVLNQISFRDVRAMLFGSAIVLVVISMILLLALRSLKLGIVSLIPNLVPALMAFGIWGFAVGEVTLAISVVFASTLGIVVDDTVHFLSKYSIARRAGDTPEEAVNAAFYAVGTAMVVTSLSLVAGFAILAQSGFAVNGDMAKLTAVTITLALIADFTLLPCLLIWWDRRRMPGNIPQRSWLGAAAILFLGTVLAVPAVAETAEEKGLAITRAVDERGRGYGDVVVEGEMILRDAAGRENRRAFRQRVLERPDPAVGDMSVIIFERPRDIRGVGLLTHAKIEPEDDDQWLYLPAVKRVKRISSSSRTGKFVGSEFSYEDLGSQEVEDYDQKWLRDESCPGSANLMCHVVEDYPRNRKSGYSKRILWIDQDEFRIHRIEFYNRRGDLEKDLSFTDYRLYKGRYWRASEMSMVNRQTGKSTDMLWSEYQFGTGLSESLFSPQRLQSLAR